PAAAVGRPQRAARAGALEEPLACPAGAGRIDRRDGAMTIVLDINGARRSTDADVDMPLLWWLRDHLGLTGTKYGCGMGLCGACTVQLDGQPVRSCQLAIQDVRGRRVTTIEGLSRDGEHPV